MVENMLLRLECQKVESNNLIGIKIIATFDLILDTACQSFICDDRQTLEKSDIQFFLMMKRENEEAENTYNVKEEKYDLLY